MSKIIKSFLSLVMVFSVMVVHFDHKIQTVDAQTGCEAYELAWVNDEGGFDTVACYSTFTEASQAMTDPDHVVRHGSSKSPTKIIAIASGIAYSYPRRNGSTTLNVYQHPDHITEKEKYKSTYVVQHRELFQPETISYNGNGEGNVKVVLNGFEGYTSLSSLDLIPMKMIEKGFSMSLGGQTNDGGIPEEPFTLVPKMSFYTVVQNGNYTDLIYTYYSGYNSAPSRLTVGPAAEWMIEGQVYYSKDGYQFYSDREMTDYLASYYNYYLFLPFRSESNISGDVLDAYIVSRGYNAKPTSTSTNSLKENQSQMVNEGNTFTQGQKVYGVNALLTYAMAWNESGAGRSTYAISKNNLFGWAAVDSNPDNASQFSSISAGIQEHMAYNLRGYMDINDVRYFGMHLGTKASGFNVKYASDPYWGFKIAAIAYDIDKFSKNYDGTLTDYNTYRLGVIDEFGASFYQSASLKSNVLMTSQYSSQYQNNHIVVIKDQTDDFYQVQSPNGVQLVNDELQLVYHKVNGVVQPAVAYSFDLSVGYLKNSSVSLLNEINEVTIEGQTPSGDFVFELETFQVDEDGILHVSGSSYRPGIYVTEDNQLIHTLAVFNDTYERITESRLVSELVEETKDECTFTGSLDLNELDDGTYYFRFNSDYSMIDKYSDTRVLKNEAESVETLYAIYTFVVEDEILWVQVETKEQVKLPEGANLAQLLEQFEYLEDSNVVRIKGLAYITGIDADEESQVHHAIQLVDMETKEVIEIPAKTMDFDSSISLGDGFTYKRIVYEVDLDVSLLKMGCYSMKIVVRNGSYEEKSTYLMDQINTLLPLTRVVNGNQIRFVKNSTSCYRYEVYVEKNNINFDELIFKPTKRNSSFGLESVTLDNGILSMQGIAWLYNVNFNSSTNVAHKVILLNQDGNVIENSASTNACVYNYNQLLNTVFDWSNICFSASVDMTKLEKGSYTIYMDVSSDGYRDVYEANNMYNIEINKVQFEDRTYTIVTSAVKNRMILTIE